VGLAAVVLSGFILAIFAPGITRAWPRASGWLLALLPLLITVYLAAQLGGITAGEVLSAGWDWVPEVGLRFSLFLDGLGLLFALLISGIGTLIFIYAGGYLAGHTHLGRIYAYLLMFMGSMLGVVLSDNLLTLFVFWELTSVASYLLIGFDNHRAAARAAALQALLVTGLGGLALLAGFVLLGLAGGSFELSELLGQREVLAGHGWYLPIVLLVVLGCFTKSAQFPFHFWLPGAMEAPTPVSAYLHSSTMVKAGIYLLARLDPVLGGTQLWVMLLTFFGAATMFVGAFLALRQTYLKRLLAYSTVSALGTIVMALGVGTSDAIKAALVFILAHALYKGALFLVAGAIDHSTGEKDVEKLGGLWRAMPLLTIAALISAISMAGWPLPPLLGFLSKELVLEGVLGMEVYGNLLAGVLTVSAAFLVLVAYLVGVKPFLARRLATPRQPHEPGAALLLGPLLLAVLGLGPALAPNALAAPLVQPAATAMLREAVTFKLTMWHGWTIALFLSLGAAVLGLALIPLRHGARGALAKFDVLYRAGPERWYEWALAGMLGLAEGQTRFLQNGYLRFYLSVTLAFAVGLVVYTLLVKTGVPPLHETADVRLYEIGLAAIILLAAIAVARARARLTAIAALGLVGYGVALVYVLFGAPDLAMTQIAIETLTVILFVLVFYHLPDFRSISTPASKVRDLAIALGGGAMMTALVLTVTALEPERTVSEHLAAAAYPQGHGRNVVNVILVDFRVLDTLGELVVLCVAGLGVWSLLRLTPRREVSK
jgi:multicomponent Na+:H+ antiporter subunit A